MKQSVVYALDFDGVICDSAIETGISGWKAASQLWDDLDTALPSDEFVDRFRQVRPIMSTGYQAILLVRQLVDGKTIDHILNNFPVEKQQIIEEFQLNIDEMKQIFGDVRDQWIKDDLDDWVGKNPLFPGIVEKLQNLSKLGNDWYIVTTKQERFVKQILKANNIQIADEKIFGLDRQRTKVETLTDLVSLHSQQKVCFVEDMLSALMKVANKKELNSINLFLAGWGYNTTADKLAARSETVKVIDMEQFLV